MILHDCNIWASLPVPTLLIGADDTIAALNPAGEVFMNTTVKTLKGQPVWDRLMIDAPMEESFARVRANQSALFLNDVDVSPGQRAPVHCNVQIAPLTGIDAPEGMLMLMVSPREIAGRLGRSLQVESAAKSAIGMAEMLAHEIKNPLAGITGAAQLLSMGLTKDDLELTDLIVAESRRIVKLLEQVEQFGNLSPPQRRAVNIHDLLDRARRSARVGFAAHMEISDDYDPSLPATFADGDQLLQVFLNLLKNAAEASKGEPGKIRLRTYYEGSLRVRRRDGTHAPVPLQVEIIDDGPGLPPSIAAEVFEPFVSGRENGTGLGLALVSKIVLDHEGWVTVDSVPGRTAFRISLPVAPTETESDEEQD
ncbi:two-component system sensor histidine kinase NtrB [Pacificitalea manganoxidans]|uniref:two-component system sensor histidine kinase NtrB n=1 Tax=Pacificitalea manganoxidans TaxID=1411902 RepID=UPI000BE275C4|nr:ATP-binding protein [Pacificitalea manganoxidans]MAQ46521.1 PAS domain-containing sensor histidine kinase [Actibacterium sp.]MDR6307743.1 two-component system nitrogen regulation sensor histidine kinase GlnL [Pacificitalea manganoxidans]